MSSYSSDKKNTKDLNLHTSLSEHIRTVDDVQEIAHDQYLDIPENKIEYIFYVLKRTYGIWRKVKNLEHQANTRSSIKQ